MNIEQTDTHILFTKFFHALYTDSNWIENTNMKSIQGMLKERNEFIAFDTHSFILFICITNLYKLRVKRDLFTCACTFLRVVCPRSESSVLAPSRILTRLVPMGVYCSKRTEQLSGEVTPNAGIEPFVLRHVYST